MGDLRRYVVRLRCGMVEIKPLRILGINDKACMQTCYCAHPAPDGAPIREGDAGWRRTGLEGSR